MGSRSTKRDQVNVCWQKLKRDEYNDEGLPADDIDLDVGKAAVKRVPYQFAKQIILKYEWLGTMSNTSIHYGIFFDNYCAGVTCVGNSAGTGGCSTHKMFGVTPQQLLILARGACVHWAPPNTNSKLVSWTCKLLKQQTDGKILLAYADTDAGEIGTIYQACNWHYLGRGSSTRQWVSPEGRVMDQKLVWNICEQQDIRKPDGSHDRDAVKRALRKKGWTRQKTNPKHRYAYVLDEDDDRLVNYIQKIEQPYPKRNAGAR